MFALHVEFFGHLVATISPKIFVERLHVARNAAPDARGMRRENSAYLRHMLMNIKQTQAGHPFMALINHLCRSRQHMPIETLDHLCRSIGKHRSLVIIAIGMQTIHLEIGPHLTIDVILLRIERAEIHQQRNRRSRNIPASHTHMQSLLLRLRTPIRIQLLISRKQRIIDLVAKIGTNEKHPVGKQLLHGLGTRRQHGVNAAHHVAHFPTRFKNIIRNTQPFNHTKNLFLSDKDSIKFLKSQ